MQEDVCSQHDLFTVTALLLMLVGRCGRQLDRRERAAAGLPHRQVDAWFPCRFHQMSIALMMGPATPLCSTLKSVGAFEHMRRP